jgi:outer membrane protein assembly factor BamB
MKLQIIGRTLVARNRRLFGPWLACVLSAGFLYGGDWPVWLGPTGDNSSPETGWLKEWPESGPPRLFEKATGGGYSAVVVASGRLVLFHREGDELVVSCLGALDGAPAWSFRYPTDYVDRYGYSSGPRCSPLIDLASEPARVFTLGPKGVLYALDFATGKKLWRSDLQGDYDLPSNFFGVGAVPLLAGERLYVNLGGTDFDTGLTFAIDKSTGKVVWKTPSGGGAYAQARLAEIDGEPQLFVFHRTGMSCYHPESGKEKWRFLWHSRIYDSVNATTPVVASDLLFFSAAYNTGSTVLRVKKESYEVVWQDSRDSRDKALESHWSNVNLVDGYLYGFSGRHQPEGALSCVELATGKVRWRWRDYLGRGSMLYADAHFIALGERGDLALLKLDSEGHEELARVEDVLGSPAWSPPVLANGLLYLRDERKLVCMDLRVKAPALDSVKSQDAKKAASPEH